MTKKKHDLVVVGGGPGGYVAAIRAAQLGLDTACIDKEKALGGTCVRVGCIPSKALLEASEHFYEAQHHLASFGVRIKGVELDLPKMLAKKDAVVKANTQGVDFLFKKNKVTRYHGAGRFAGNGKLVVDAEGEAEAVELEAKHFLIATGSTVAKLRGVDFDGDRIGGSTEALSYPEVPGHLVVIGAGYIGLELGSVWARLGSKVTVLEYLDRILPGMDSEIASEALKVLKKQGLDFRLRTKFVGAGIKSGTCIVEIDGAGPVECDRVLVAVGRAPYTEGLGLDSVGLELDERGRIPVNEHFVTNVDGIYAIGDVIRGPMLAHKAEDEGIACVEHIATGYGHVNYDAIPGVVYTNPEVASVGKSEEELREQGVEYKKGVFPYSANGRARALGMTEGRVKILADAKTDRILGVHVLGARAGDLIAEATAAIEFAATSEDLARTCHAHPTLAEIMREAAFAVHGRAIHI
jgi:dihydrolipoamide dehydrogenase